MEVPREIKPSQSSWFSRKKIPTVWQFILILTFSLAIRILYAFLIWEHILQGDAQSYWEDSLKLYSGMPYTPFWPPGLPLLLGLSGFIGLQIPGSIVLLMLGIYILCMVGVFVSLKELIPQNLSLFPLFILSILPVWIHHSVVPLTQLPTAAGLIWLFYFLIRIHKQPKLFLVLTAGLILGICILIRPSCLSILLLLIYLGVKEKQMKFLGYFLAVCMLVVGGWQYRNIVTGSPHIFLNSANSYNLFVGNNPYTPSYKTWWLSSHFEGENEAYAPYYHLLFELKEKKAIEHPHLFLESVLDEVKKRPQNFVIRTFHRMKTFWASDSFTGGFLFSHYASPSMALLALMGDFLGYILLMWLALGMVGSPNSPYSQVSKWLMLGILCYAFPYFFAFSHPTYHFPLLPFICLLASFRLSKLQNLKTLLPLSPGRVVLQGIFIGIQLEWIWRMYILEY